MENFNSLSFNQIVSLAHKQRGNKGVSDFLEKIGVILPSGEVCREVGVQTIGGDSNGMSGETSKYFKTASAGTDSQGQEITQKIFFEVR